MDNTRISEKTFSVPLGFEGYLLTIGMSNNEIFTPDICDFIFGIFDNDFTPYNNIIASIKYYMYKSRCLNLTPTLQGLLFDIKNMCLSAKYLAVKRNTLGNFQNQWDSWSFLF